MGTNIYENSFLKFCQGHCTSETFSPLLYRSAITESVSRQLSMLFASTAHFTGARSEFHVKLLYSFTADETTRLIRSIGDLARTSSPVWSKHEWTKRKWLTDEMSAVRIVFPLQSIPFAHTFVLSGVTVVNHFI